MRATHGVEDVVAGELRGLPGVRVGDVEHRLVSGECDGSVAALAGLTRIRSADDAFVEVACFRGMERARSALGLLAERAAAIDLRPALAVVAGLRPLPPKPGLSLTASFVGRRNYTSDELEGTLAQAVTGPHGLAVVADERTATVHLRLVLEGDQARIGLRLAQRPLHERPWKAAHRPGSLKPSVAAALWRLAGLGSGLRALDPCCGVGTLVAEAAATGARAFGGDLDRAALEAAAANLGTLGMHAWVAGWDARSLPLRSESIDAAASNLPWGRQVGSEKLRDALHAELGPELARVLVPRGLAVVLTDAPERFEPGPLRDRRDPRDQPPRPPSPRTGALVDQGGGMRVRRLRRCLTAAAFAALLAPSFTAEANPRWRTESDGERWWLRQPDGARFFSIGVNVVDGEPDRLPRRGELQYGWSRAHASPQDWVAATRGRLLDWGFNTLGGWSRRESEFGLPYTAVLSFGQRVNAIWGDPFAPETPERMREEAVRTTLRHPGGPLCVGYFSDNEVGWWNAPLLFWFLRKEPENHTRQRLVSFLRERYSDFAAFQRDFSVPAAVDSFDSLAAQPVSARLAAGGDGVRTLRQWTAIVVGRYYAMAEAAVRHADPTALVLGDRLPIYWDEDALRAIGSHVDVLAVNYDVATPGGWVAPYFFEGLRDLVPAPVLVSEWFFASHENRTGNANRGQLMTVSTQAERAEGAAAAARRLASFPNVVGLHWFQLSDQPPGGRSDGEDYSHGLVDVHDVPYEDFTRALGAVNRTLPELHATARWEGAAASPVEIPRAPTGGGVHGARLDDWDLPATRLRFPRGGDGLDVPFADVHLAFTDDALLVFTIGQDFFDPDLYERDALAPGDALTLHLMVSPEVPGAAATERHVAIQFEPAALVQPADFPPSEQRVGVYEPRGYVVRQGGVGLVAEPRIEARRLRSISPRFDGLVVIPRDLLGLAGVPPGTPFGLEVAVVGFLRGRGFTLSGQTVERALSEPPQVRAVLALNRAPTAQAPRRLGAQSPKGPEPSPGL